MEKCKTKRNLEVHHRNRHGGNGLNNAQVLCQDCHSQTASYGKPGKSPEPFSEKTKELALQKANHKCQCAGCPHCLTQRVLAIAFLRKANFY